MKQEIPTQGGSARSNPAEVGSNRPDVLGNRRRSAFAESIRLGVDSSGECVPRSIAGSSRFHHATDDTPAQSQKRSKSCGTSMNSGRIPSRWLRRRTRA